MLDNPQSSAGIITKHSSQSVAETLDRLRRLIEDRGFTLFRVIDHSGTAERVGVQMPESKLVMFRKPTVGASVMLAAPPAGLDFPLKVLVWEDGNGAVSVSYNSPGFLAERYHIDGALRARPSTQLSRSLRQLSLQYRPAGGPMPGEMNIDGQVAVVTGARSGVGHQYALHLAQHGTRVLEKEVEGVGMEVAHYRATRAFEIEYSGQTYHRFILFSRPPDRYAIRFAGVTRETPPSCAFSLFVRGRESRLQPNAAARPERP